MRTRMAAVPSSDALSASAQRPRLRRLGIAVLALALAGTAFASWRMWRDPKTAPKASDDPRITYAGPYRNVRPDVAFVGDEGCSECHRDQEGTYRRHPMANTLLPIARAGGTQPLDKEHHNPFPAFDSLFHIDVEGERVWHRQTRLDAA